ncbi:MAG: glycosyltransferase family 2 protein [Fibrobacterota bacterium]
MITVIVPLFNEEESLTPLAEKVFAVADREDYSLEMLFVDDGSTDGSLGVLKSLVNRYEGRVSYLSFGQNRGKSAALRAGFAEAAGEYIITMDADLQDDPAAIPAMLEKIDEGWDLVSGWKKRRVDPVLSKNLPSKIFNFVTSSLSGIHLHDFNCGFKAYRRAAAQSLDIYGERHRFLPAMAYWNGYAVTEIPVPHHKRQFGTSKFGINRFVNGFFDLVTLLFLRRYMANPLHFFGLLSLVLILAGLGILGYFGVQWAMGESLHVRPLILFAVTSIIVGVQFFSIGLLGELFINTGGTRFSTIKERGGAAAQRREERSQ